MQAGRTEQPVLLEAYLRTDGAVYEVADVSCEPHYRCQWSHGRPRSSGRARSAQPSPVAELANRCAIGWSDQGIGSTTPPRHLDEGNWPTPHLVPLVTHCEPRPGRYQTHKGANKGASARSETAEIWQVEHELGRQTSGGTAYRMRGIPMSCVPIWVDWARLSRCGSHGAMP